MCACSQWGVLGIFQINVIIRLCGIRFSTLLLLCDQLLLSRVHNSVTGPVRLVLRQRHHRRGNIAFYRVLADLFTRIGTKGKWGHSVRRAIYSTGKSLGFTRFFCP